MEGDSFSDPRRRAARRSAGGARGRGRGQQYSRGSQKRNAPRTKPKPDQNLGSNEYRFRVTEEDEYENVYDAGIDFEEAASQQIADSESNEGLGDAAKLSDELAADFAKLESVLASVPLWVRLGEHARFALGVPEEESVENYLEPLPLAKNTVDELKKPKDQVSEEFLSDLANVTFDDDETTSKRLNRPESDESSENYAPKLRERKKAVSARERVEEDLASPEAEELGEFDEFDKWLDEI